MLSNEITGFPTFQRRSSPAEEVEDHFLSIPETPQILECQTSFSIAIVLGKYVLELLRPVATLGVISHAIAAMLVLVDAGEVDPEERIWQDTGNSRIGQIWMDDDDCKEGKWNTPAYTPTSGIEVK